jgi:hypothetical protein
VQKYYEPFRGCEWPGVLCPIFQQSWNLTFGTFLNDPTCTSCIFTTAAYLANPTIPKTTNSCQCNTTPQTCVAGNAGICEWKILTSKCEAIVPAGVPPQLVQRYLSLNRAYSDSQINTGNI